MWVLQQVHRPCPSRLSLLAHVLTFSAASASLQVHCGYDVYEVLEGDGIAARAADGDLLDEAGSSNSCAWRRQDGEVFLFGHARDTAVASRTLQRAQAACEALGVQCGGVTLQPCDESTKDTALFTLRAGRVPHPSPVAEVSWLKHCESVGGSETASSAAEVHEAWPMPTLDHCHEAHNEELRQSLLAYYLNGSVSPRMLAALQQVLLQAALKGWQGVAEECAPAALLGLLTRAVERSYVDDVAYRDLSQTYATLRPLVLEVIPNNHELWQSWPLQLVEHRFLEADAHFRRSREWQAVDFVVCFCGVDKSPGGGYAAVSDSLVWMQELLQDVDPAGRELVRVFVKEKCGDASDQEHIRSQHRTILGMLKPLVQLVEILDVKDELRADDATAYLDHLVRRFDDLATWTFFLHADVPEHIFPFTLMQEVLSAAMRGSLDTDAVPFVYLTHNYLDMRTSRFTWDDYASPRQWQQLFGSSVVPNRTQVAGYCCVQFLVSKSRARLRTLRWYNETFSWFASSASYFDLFPGTRPVLTWQDLTSRTPSQLWMPWWHIVFGENLRCPQRHQDRRLPLFIRLKSIPLKELLPSIHGM